MKHSFLSAWSLIALCCSCTGKQESTPDTSHDSVQEMIDTLSTIPVTLEKKSWPETHKEELKQLFYKTIGSEEVETDTLEFANDFDFDQDGQSDCIVRNFFAEDYRTKRKLYSSVLFTCNEDSVRAIAYDEFHHYMTIFDGGKVTVFIRESDSTYVTLHHAIRNGNIEKTIRYENMNIDYINDTVHYKTFDYQPLFQ